MKKINQKPGMPSNDFGNEPEGEPNSADQFREILDRRITHHVDLLRKLA